MEARPERHGMEVENVNTATPGEKITREHIAGVIQSRFGFEAKEKQADAIHKLVHDQKDQTLIVKNRFREKHCLSGGAIDVCFYKTSLIIMPLITLEKQQCEKLRKYSGLQTVCFEYRS